MDALINRREVERQTGLARSTIYKNMRAGRFPLPIKISTKAVRWRQADIAAYIEGRPLAEGIQPNGAHDNSNAIISHAEQPQTEGDCET